MKIKQYVVCINNLTKDMEQTYLLTVGKLYGVIMADSTHYFIKNDEEVRCAYNKNLFIPVLKVKYN